MTLREKLRTSSSVEDVSAVLHRNVGKSDEWLKHELQSALSGKENANWAEGVGNPPVSVLDLIVEIKGIDQNSG